MASLPRDRVLVCPPFTNTGCDYAGPFYVRHGSARKTHTKVYAVIFVCMSTKAVLIELAEDLSAQAFLDVFDRFVSRRGLCKTMYSDNGTQFQAAARILHQDLVHWRNNTVQQYVG